MKAVSTRSGAMATSCPANRKRLVAQQGARHQTGLGQHLEAVADARATRPPSAANAATARMIGLNRAITPARR